MHRLREKEYQPRLRMKDVPEGSSKSKACTKLRVYSQRCVLIQSLVMIRLVNAFGHYLALLFVLLPMSSLTLTTAILWTFARSAEHQWRPFNCLSAVVTNTHLLLSFSSHTTVLVKARALTPLVIKLHIGPLASSDCVHPFHKICRWNHTLIQGRTCLEHRDSICNGCDTFLVLFVST